MWRGRHVVLGVSGGIAAYKSVLLARDLTRRGAKVDVLLSRGASQFVGAVTFEAVTRRKVRTSLWESDSALDHITLGDRADLTIVAPATANLIARLAAGIADDLLSTMLLANGSPVLMAPAMNDRMYSAAPTRENLRRLLQRGWNQVGPDVGDLAEGPSESPGRMASPEAIIAHAERVLAGEGPLHRRRVVVTAGPTREMLDPVRAVTNRSSGKMGYRIAAAAWRRGADVALISGPSAELPPIGVGMVRVETTKEMAEAVGRELPSADLLVMAAAPADYRPSNPASRKTPRSEGGLQVTLEPTEDILLETMSARHPGLTMVGFALETGDAIAKGRDKLVRKQLDMIVINDAEQPGAGFDVDTNAVTILDSHGMKTNVPLSSKAEVAEAILDAIEQYRG